MKKFADEAALRKFALSKGASATVGESEFNSSRQRASITPRPAPKAVPAPPAPAPVKETVVVDNTAAVDAMRQQTAALVKLFEELKSEVKQAAVAGSTSPTEWDFAIERDKNGLIQKISAKAKRPQMH